MYTYTYIYIHIYTYNIYIYIYTCIALVDGDASSDSAVEAAQQKSERTLRRGYSIA